MGTTSDKARQRLKTLSRGLSDKEINETYGPRATPSIKAARDIGDSEVRQRMKGSTGSTSGPSQTKKLISTANPMKGLTNRAASAINEKRRRERDLQKEIDNE